MQLLGHIGDRFVDPAFHLERVDAGNDGTQAFIENRLGHQRRGGGSIAGDVVGLAGHFTDHFGAHIFVNVFQIDFLRDRHAVFGDERASEAFLNNDVASPRTQSHFNGLSQFGHAAAHGITGFLIKRNHFCHIKISLKFGLKPPFGKP